MTAFRKVREHEQVSLADEGFYREVELCIASVGCRAMILATSNVLDGGGRAAVGSIYVALVEGKVTMEGVLS